MSRRRDASKSHMNEQANKAGDGALALSDRSGGKLTVSQMDAQDVLSQVAVIREIMNKAMEEGIHYGRIPGTDKPTLLLPGAQKLGMTFRFRTSYPKVERVELPGGHREYFITSRIEDGAGNFMGEGLGSCTTMESKYRYRKTSAYEATEHLVPQSYWKYKDKKDKQRCLAQIMDDVSTPYGVKKIPDNPTGVWYIVAYKSDAEKEEYPNPADYYNTVLKIGKKRAFVDAILTVTAAGDLFTQDLEDLSDNREALQEETGREWPEAGTTGDSKPAETDTKPKQDKPAGKDKPPKTTSKAADSSPNYKAPEAWRENIVHFASTLKDRKLGTLTLDELILIRDKWINDPKFWGTPYKKDGETLKITPTTQDEALKEKVLEAIAELTASAPATGAPQDWDALKYVTQIQDELAERGIAEARYFEILRLNNQIPDGANWTKIDDVDDQDWLKHAAGTLDLILRLHETKTAHQAQQQVNLGAQGDGIPGTTPAPADPPTEPPKTDPPQDRGVGYVAAPAKPVRRRAAAKKGEK